MANKIPLGKPFLKKEVILKKIEEVLDRAWISGGPTISEFENLVKQYNQDNNGYYIAVANATVGLEMALLRINGGKRYNSDDEIIVPSWSWIASALAITNVGAKPIWVDVNGSGVVSVDKVENRITNKTKAILIVHQMGVPCDLDAFNKLSDEHGIPIIEDTACGFGSEYKGIKLGNSKNICVYSFQARKCLTTGEGGMISCRNKEDAEWFKSYRAFGTNVSPLMRDSVNYLLKEQFDKFGTNYKISDIQCALGIAHLSYFDEEISLRETASKYYNKLLQQLGGKVSNGLIMPTYCTRYNYQNYHVILNEKYNRDYVVDSLRKRNIGAKWDIQAMHLEPIYKKDDNLFLPNTQTFHDRGLWLPFYAEITREDQDRVIDTLNEILK